MTQFEVKTDEVDMEVVAELCEFLHDAFEVEIQDGATSSELVLAIGTVLTYMFGEDEGRTH